MRLVASSSAAAAQRGHRTTMLALLVLALLALASLQVSGQPAPGGGPGNPLDPFDEVGAKEAREEDNTVGPKCVDSPFRLNPRNSILNACCHPKFFTPLRRPQTMPFCFIDATGKHHYGVTMRQVRHDFGVQNRTSLLPIDSQVWAYGPDCTETFDTRIYTYANADLSDVTLNSPEVLAAGYHSVPGGIFPVVSNEGLFVLWKNELPVKHLFQAELDLQRPFLHCGLMAPNCKPDSRTVIHFHGGHTLPQYDGFPNAWFTQNSTIDNQKVDRVRNGWDGGTEGDCGEDFFTREYYYQVDQEAGTFWYHDHSMGITSLNVYAGLAGLLLIRDQREHALQMSGVLPSGQYEMPLVLKDYWFDQETGQLFYTKHGEHEFFANYSAVNGVVWPYMEVEPTRYRFRILNSCNSRILRLTLKVDLPDEGKFDHDCDGSPSPEKERTRETLNMTMVFTDGGMITKPAPISEFYITPAERYDIVVDFSKHAGKNITMHNIAQLEMGLPWKCPPNCAPGWNTGPDRWLRFVVAPTLKPRRPKGQQSKEPNWETMRMKVTSASTEPAAQTTEPIAQATASTTTTGADATSSTHTHVHPAESSTTSTSSTPPANPTTPASPPAYTSPRRRSWFDSPTSVVTSPFPSTLRGPLHSGAVDRVRQIILIEVSHAVAFNARHHHPGAPQPKQRKPTIVTVNEQGEVHNNNNLKHGDDQDNANAQEDEIYMFTINDPRFETGVFFDDIVNTGEACTTERWELINISNDTHAIHIHQIEFELIGRANFSFFRFGADPVIRLDTIRPAEPYERGPKDLFLVNPGEIAYVQGFFDLHGRYVTHCHMLEHEDMEMMHTLEMKPGKCTCVQSPLLREREIIPATGLPYPNGMDAESVRERARLQAIKQEKLDERADATTLYEEWRAELMRKAQPNDVPVCAAPTCSPPHPLNSPPIFPCTILPDSDRSTCPVNYFSDFDFLRDRLSRLALECEPDPAAVGVPCDLVPDTVLVSINDLHSSICPGQPHCAPTQERTVQSDTIDQTERTRRAISEDANLQAVPPVGIPNSTTTGEQISAAAKAPQPEPTETAGHGH